MSMIHLMKWMAPGVALALVTVLAGCEDAPPSDYVPEYVVRGYLLVDQPIRDIQITHSQSLTDTFKVERSIVSDADVRVIVDGRTLQLQYRATGNGPGEYYLPDTTELVQPGKRYTLEITTKDGAELTAQTLTPQRFDWVRPPAGRVIIPKKSDPAYLKPPDSLDLIWTEDAGLPEYLISVRALDTSGYGKYLAPETPEPNERVNPDLDEFDENRYNEMTRWGFIAGTRTPIVWAAFRWYGPHEVVVYAADRSFINWFKMTQWSGNPEYDPLLGNVQGGIGVFGSASVIRADVMLLKNRE